MSDGVNLVVQGYECYGCGLRVVVYKDGQLSHLPAGWGSPWRDRNYCPKCLASWEGEEGSSAIHFAVVEVGYAEG